MNSYQHQEAVTKETEARKEIFRLADRMKQQRQGEAELVWHAIQSFYRLSGKVQASSMFGLGTSMYESSVERWRLMILSGMEYAKQNEADLIQAEADSDNYKQAEEQYYMDAAQHEAEIQAEMQAQSDQAEAEAQAQYEEDPGDGYEP